MMTGKQSPYPFYRKEEKTMTPRQVKEFPTRGNHIGDLIRLPSGQIYEWIRFKRWQRYYGKETHNDVL